MLLDRSGEAVEVSPSYPHLLGYDVAHRCALRTAELIHPGDLEHWKRGWSRVLEQPDGTSKVVLRIRHARGEWCWMEVALVNRLDDPDIGGVVAVIRSITEPKTGEKYPERSDGLGALEVLDHKGVEDLLDQTLARHDPSGQVLVVMVRLDQLHLIARACGRTRADELLDAVSARLRAGLRDWETLRLIDGDRLVVICETRGGTETGVDLAERVAGVLREPFHRDDDGIVLTASIGISAATSPGATAATLLADADLAMAGAAHRGGNRWSLFSTAERADLVREVTLPAALRQALADEQFVVHYQPVVDLETGEPVGAEALVRWSQADGTLAGPDSFIAVAERSGLIVEIGAWVLQEACRAAARWAPGPTGVGYVAVNISARQLEDPKLPTIVEAALVDAGIEPTRLTLEITESVLVADPETATRRLESLRKLGVRVAMDDFGTGYSSLASLKRLPIDIVKIDQSFVGGLGHDGRDAAIVAAVVTLAEAFGLDVVAEGVETELQAGELRRLGCRHAQGYLYGRPAPAGQPSAVRHHG